MTIHSAFSAYVDARDDASLRTLQRLVTADPGFERGTPWRDRAEELLAEDRHDEVIRLLTGLMPGLLLSPVAHAMLSHAHERIGQRNHARREAFYAELAISAILDSGSGTPDAPWRVLQVADEYAVLERLGLVRVSQRSVGQGAVVDVVTCTDGTERWFELTSGGTRR